jgi:hypothetical protein
MHVLPVDEKEAAAQRHRIHLQALKADHKTAMRTLRSNKYFVEFLRKVRETVSFLACGDVWCSGA